MSVADVAIIDSGGANIASLVFALGRLSVDCRLTTDADEISGASHVILPGVGAAEDAMRRLRQSELHTLIPTLEQPVLGICLGMQLLAEGSQENNAECLGIVPGVAARLSVEQGYPVPNMGWCRINICAEHSLLKDIPNGAWFYFLHSYALPVVDYTTATADHSRSFTAILSYRNYHATQFHPERSAASGEQLLRNFLDLGK